MISGSREHRRYLDRLAREAAEDADHVTALLALSRDDLGWLHEMGWQEPAHAKFVRLNR